MTGDIRCLYRHTKRLSCVCECAGHVHAAKLGAALMPRVVQFVVRLEVVKRMGLGGLLHIWVTRSLTCGYRSCESMSKGAQCTACSSMTFLAPPAVGSNSMTFSNECFVYPR